MFEARHQPLLDQAAFARRVIYHFMIGLAILAGSLLIGVLGYHFIERLGWLDALLNAAMILGSMGPVDPVRTSAGKVFASAYALYSGIVFIVVVGVMLAPVVHRILHHFHIGGDETA
jgi:ABC-type uncharacterized transport system permease subunit